MVWVLAGALVSKNPPVSHCCQLSVPSVAALQSVLAAHKPGDRVSARISRDGTQSTVQLTLGSLTS
jgi:hypothetical protein